MSICRIWLFPPRGRKRAPWRTGLADTARGFLKETDMGARIPLAAIALVLFLGTAAHAAGPMRFDLVCTGTATHIDANASPSYVVDTAPIAMRLSVDLNAKRWCYRDAQCNMTFPVASVESDMVHLLAVKTDLNEASFDYNRSTGAYSRRLFTPQFSVPTLSSGACVTAPFTPIR